MPFAALLLLAALAPSFAAMPSPLLIAHRGASGYLPEHTLEAAGFAHALGADYIEQDVVMTRDDVLIVSHDIHLDTTTDVATRFPDRARPDGRYYAVDFDWPELQQLEVRERFDPATGRRVYPGRFPPNGAAFRLCTMEAQLRLIQGLNQSTGRRVGVYPEIKAPAWHAREGKDPGPALLALLARYGYTQRSDPAIVQCFDPAELQRLRQAGSDLTFVLLLENRGSSTHPPDPHLDSEGLAQVATYAQGIGPPISLLFAPERGGPPQPSSLVHDAHAAGLVVHAYTFRADALPAGQDNLPGFVRSLLALNPIDGLFTDHLDRTGLR